GPALPSGWAVGNWASPKNGSTHQAANVGFVGGTAVLSLTADGAAPFAGTPPPDLNAGTDPGPGQSAGGAGGNPGTGGAAAPPPPPGIAGSSTGTDTPGNGASGSGNSGNSGNSGGSTAAPVNGTPPMSATGANAAGASATGTSAAPSGNRPLSS